MRLQNNNYYICKKDILLYELKIVFQNRDCKYCGKNKPYSKLNYVFCSDECYDESEKNVYYDDSQ
jgi:hypothetical protein